MVNFKTVYNFTEQLYSTWEFVCTVFKGKCFPFLICGMWDLFILWLVDKIMIHMMVQVQQPYPILPWLLIVGFSLLLVFTLMVYLYFCNLPINDTENKIVKYAFVCHPMMVKFFHYVHDSVQYYYFFHGFIFFIPLSN